MKKMLKYISVISIFIAMCLAIGCKSQENVQIITVDQNSNTNKVMQSGFNQKHYIWEFWTVSTNKYNEGVK